MMNNSLEPRLAILVMNRGTNRAPKNKIKAMNSPALRAAIPSMRDRLSPDSPSAGSINIAKAAPISCIKRIPTITLPCTDSSSPRLVSIPITTMVLLKAIRKPKITASWSDHPKRVATPIPRAVVTRS